MKILLIQPPVEDFYDTDIRLQPIGLYYLKSTLEQHHPDLEVIVKDFHCGYGRRTVRLPAELEYLKEYYGQPDQSPFCGFHNFYCFGARDQTIEDEIRQIQPDVVGISSLFTPYYREVLNVAAIVKSIADIPVLLGGSHVSALPDFMLSHPNVDFVITGEGEKPIVEFINFFKNKIELSQVPNLGFKKDGQIIFNAKTENYPIEEIPVPALPLEDVNKYNFYGKPMALLITSRSCPHRCSFCSVHLTFGYKYRRRSVESVFSEIKQRYDEGYRVIDFEDDNLTFYKPEMKALCHHLIESGLNKKMQFVAMNGISYLSLDSELLQLMKAAGFTHLNLALVSSDISVRQSTKRPHTIEAYLRVVDEANALGFKIVSYQILGLPNEKLDSMIQTLAFNARLPVLLGASMFYQTPNSPIAKDLKLTEKDYFLARLTSMAIETEDFKRSDIYTLFITTRIIDFLKSLPLQADQSLDWIIENMLLHGREKLGQELLRRLLSEERLYYWTSKTPIENIKFNSSLFFRVLQQVEYIATEAGYKIICHGSQWRVHDELEVTDVSV